MTDVNVHRRTRLEIRNKIDYFEERMCVFPQTRKDAQRMIEELRIELDRLNQDLVERQEV